MSLPSLMKESNLPEMPKGALIIDFDKLVGLKSEDVHQSIVEFEEYLLTLPQDEYEINHYFSNQGTEHGVYVRELKIPATHAITGRVHRFETVNILAGGSAVVASIDGTKLIKAPHIFISSPGAKRLIFSVEDATWVNCFATKLTDPEEALDEHTFNPNIKTKEGESCQL